jgi:hypothetical protein
MKNIHPLRVAGLEAIKRIEVPKDMVGALSCLALSSEAIGLPQAYPFLRRDAFWLGRGLRP